METMNVEKYGVWHHRFEQNKLPIQQYKLPIPHPYCPILKFMKEIVQRLKN